MTSIVKVSSFRTTRKRCTAFVIDLCSFDNNNYLHIFNHSSAAKHSLN